MLKKSKKNQHGPLFFFIPAVLIVLGSVVINHFISQRFSSTAQVFEGQDPINLAELTGQYDQGSTEGEFHGQQVASAEVTSEITPSISSKHVLGVSNESKHIEVDLSVQRLYAFEGDKKVFDFLISSGKWGRTPTGTFHIWGKFRYTKMSGGNKQLHTYYYLPNVPFVMFFSNDEIPAARGFSLHGTYWHSNFGHPMSHGCVNMKTEEIEQLYYWAGPDVGDKKTIRASEDNPGTEIIIYGEAPRE